MTRQKVCVKVPASTANMGPGFDSIGMALNLFEWIEMAEAEQTEIRPYGEQMTGIATDKSNLIYEVAQLVFAEAGVSCPELEISMYSDIPLTRGLGSSASAIIGGMVAANAMIGSPLSPEKLFHMAARLEDHPDNVGASLFGGIIVAFWDGARAEHIRIEPHTNLEVLVVIPDFHLSTEKARLALPKQVSMQDAVFNLSHSSLLVAALCAGRFDLIKHAMKDRLHQPYRSKLIPGMETILEQADRFGALGAALSGAGPTLLTLVDASSPDNKPVLERFLLDTLAKENISSHTLWLKPCSTGAELLTPMDGNSTFIEKIKGVRA